MSIGLAKFTVSPLGLIVSTLLGNVFSTMWFMVLFDRLWDKYSGFNEEELKKIRGRSQRKSVVSSLVEQLISTYMYAVIAENMEIKSLACAAGLGVVLWLGFIATVGANEVLWHGEKIQFYALQQACYLLRTVIKGVVYVFLAAPFPTSMLF